MNCDALATLGLDHVEMYVGDVDRHVADYVGSYGFRIAAVSPPQCVSHRSIALQQGSIVLVITQALDAGHPAASFVEVHGDGIADIALRTADTRAAFAAAISRGATALQAPHLVDGLLTARIRAFGDVVHTLVERVPGETSVAGLPWLVPVDEYGTGAACGLRAIDHFAVCVGAGDLGAATRFYEEVLGFARTLEERIVLGGQLIDTCGVRNAAGDVTLVLIEPSSEHEPGHIDAFLQRNRGAGVQHLAFICDDIVTAVRTLRDRGVLFLHTPDTYYEQLTRRLALPEARVRRLQAHGVLADTDSDGQLLQIFMYSTHPRGTFFHELIERVGGTGFGSRNIRALYESVELALGEQTEAL